MSKVMLDKLLRRNISLIELLRILTKLFKKKKNRLRLFLNIILIILNLISHVDKRFDYYANLDFVCWYYIVVGTSSINYKIFVNVRI